MLGHACRHWERGICKVGPPSPLRSRTTGSDVAAGDGGLGSDRGPASDRAGAAGARRTCLEKRAAAVISRRDHKIRALPPRRIGRSGERPSLQRRGRQRYYASDRNGFERGWGHRNVRECRASRRVGCSRDRASPVVGETGKQAPEPGRVGLTGGPDGLRRSELWFQHWLPEWFRRPATGYGDKPNRPR